VDLGCRVSDVSQRLLRERVRRMLGAVIPVVPEAFAVTCAGSEFELPQPGVVALFSVRGCRQKPTMVNVIAGLLKAVFRRWCLDDAVLLDTRAAHRCSDETRRMLRIAKCESAYSTLKCPSQRRVCAMAKRARVPGSGRHRCQRSAGSALDLGVLMHRRNYPVRLSGRGEASARGHRPGLLSQPEPAVARSSRWLA